MKIAIVLTGETRTWEQDASTVTPSVDVSKKYKEFKELFKNQLDIDVDFYGVTWKHCKLTKNLDFFNKVRKFDFEKEYKNKFDDIIQYKANRFNVDKHTMTNEIAQLFMWFQGIKFADSVKKYDWIIKLRWDIFPNFGLLEEIIQLDFNTKHHIPTLATCNHDVYYYYNLEGDFIAKHMHIDWIWAVNLQLMNEYLRNTSVYDILKNDVTRKMLFGCVSNEFTTSKALMMRSKFMKHNITRVIDSKMKNHWMSIEDIEKNAKKVNRLPT